MKGITCSKYAKPNVFKSFWVCIDVILCGI